MCTRRRYAELQRAPEPVAPTADSPPEPEVAGSDGTPAQSALIMKLQQSAGNVATQRLLRTTSSPEGEAPDAAAAGDQRDHERALLVETVVPTILDRLALPEVNAVRESLAEVAVLARRDLCERLGASGRSLRLYSTTGDLQCAVLDVARARGTIIPGRRPSEDRGGVEREARSLAELVAGDVPDITPEVTAGGVNLKFNGKLSASHLAAGGSIAATGGLTGATMTGTLGSVALRGAIERDRAEVGLRVDGPVAYDARIAARRGAGTSWEVRIELKNAHGTDPLPEPAAMRQLATAASADIEEAARYVDGALSGGAPISTDAIAQRLAPSLRSLGAIIGYVRDHDARPQDGPQTAVTISAKGESATVTPQLKVTITF